MTGGAAAASSVASSTAVDAAAAAAEAAAAAGSRIAAAEAAFQLQLVGSKMRRTLAKRHEWHASDAGMLGCSYDSTTNTIMTGSFDGQVKHWLLNTKELENLDHLPVGAPRTWWLARGRMPARDGVRALTRVALHVHVRDPLARCCCR